MKSIWNEKSKSNKPEIDITIKVLKEVFDYPNTSTFNIKYKTLKVIKWQEVKKNWINQVNTST